MTLVNRMHSCYDAEVIKYLLKEAVALTCMLVISWCCSQAYLQLDRGGSVGVWSTMTRLLSAFS